MKTFMKFLMLFMVGMFVLNGVAILFKNVKRSVSAPVTYTPPPQQSAAVQAQQPAVPAKPEIPALKPVEGINVADLTKGKMVLSVYGDNGCSRNDTVPLTPAILSVIYTDTEVNKFTVGQFAPKAVFPNCTLSTLRFYFVADEEGTYTFASNHDNLRIGIRMNGVQVCQFSEQNCSGNVRLERGVYDVEVRISKEYHSWEGHYPFTLLIKKPSQNMQTVMQNSDVYSLQADVAKLDIGGKAKK